jgi:MFS family permease
MVAYTDARTGFFGLLRAQPALVPLFSLVSFVMMGMGMVAPVLSFYAESFGVPATAVGLMITVFGLARLAVDIPAGILSERYGRRLLLFGGPLVLAVASLGCALAESYGALLFWRTLQGVGSGVYMTGAMAAAADMGTPQTRGRIMALYQTALLVGAGLGPVVGGLVAERFGYAAPFYGFAAVTAVATGVALALVGETRPASAPGQDGDHGHGLAETIAILRDRDFALVSAVNFGVFFTRTAAQWMLIPLLALARFGYDSGVVGLALGLTAGINLVMLPVVGAAVDRLGARRVIVASTATATAALALLGLGTAAPLFWAGIALLGIAMGLGGPSSGAYAANAAPSGRFGPGMGIFRAAGDAGFVLGPILTGAVVDALGAGGETGLVVAMMVNAVLVAATGLGLWAYAHDR